MNPRVLRRLAQAASFILLAYVIWVTRYPLEGFVNPAFYFYVDPLVMISTAIAERVWLSGLLLSIFTLAITAVFGRVFCGWFCPLGATFDLLNALNPVRKTLYREKGPGRWRYSKYYLFAAVILAAVAGIQTAWLFDPIATFVRVFSFNIHPAINNGIDRVFAFLVERSGFYPPLESVYNFLKSSVLNPANLVFPHSSAVFAGFIFIAGLTFVERRFWCRYVCPLGAMLALAAKFAPYRRRVSSCSGRCSLCKDKCRMNAIKPDNSYIKEECVLCMDCTALCPGQNAEFAFYDNGAQASGPAGKISRKQFLLALAGSLAALSGCKKRSAGLSTVIRPPASLPEPEFVDRCIRCGNCMKVCLTNALQPTLFETGPAGIWTPKLDAGIGYCEYQCVLCGNVCPTGAIKRITEEQKRSTKLGVAVVQQDICIPWATGETCLVCQEHCPVSSKAIKMIEYERDGKVVNVPVIDTSLCVGCAICEFKCPVPGSMKGITVVPL